MRRIAIVGNGGAGKTVLANKLGRLLGIAVTHLDALRYAEDWTPVPEQAFVARQRQAMAADRWIIDGNALASLAGRAAAADTVIVVEHACGAEVVHLTSRRQVDQYLAVLTDRIGGQQ